MINTKELELEERIRKIIADENDRLTAFEYQKHPPDRFALKVSTYNKQTKELTLMYEVDPSISKTSCLMEVLNYLEIVKPTLSPFEMRWVKKGEGADSTVSHFYCNDMVEVLDKFFATRKKEEYTIYSLEMKGYA